MYQAIGRSAKRNSDTSITVKVDIIDDRKPVDTKFVRSQEYRVSNVAELKAAILTDLNELRDSERDATLNAAIVGIVLGEI